MQWRSATFANLNTLRKKGLILKLTPGKQVRNKMQRYFCQVMHTHLVISFISYLSGLQLPTMQVLTFLLSGWQYFLPDLHTEYLNISFCRITQNVSCVFLYVNIRSRHRTISNSTFFNFFTVHRIQSILWMIKILPETRLQSAYEISTNRCRKYKMFKILWFCVSLSVHPPLHDKSSLLRAR